MLRAPAVLLALCPHASTEIIQLEHRPPHVPAAVLLLGSGVGNADGALEAPVLGGVLVVYALLNYDILHRLYAEP